MAEEHTPVAKLVSVFDSVDDAKAAAAALAQQFPKPRFVYRVHVEGREDRFVVAQNVNLARARAIKFYEDLIQVAPVDAPARKPKTVEEIVQAMTPDDVAKARKLLDEMIEKQEGDTPEKPAHKGKKK